MASRKLSDLSPEVAEKAQQFLDQCKDQGIDVLIYCTLRDFKEQNDLYAQGRTKPGKIVTNARGGDSWHNWGRAFDCVPLVGGKPAWDSQELYRKIGAIGESVGLEWAGRWTGKLKETAHFQYTGGLTLNQIKNKGFENGGTNHV